MLKVSDEIASYIKDLFPNGTTENKLKKLIENELVRRLSRYQLTIRNMENKYNSDFVTFKSDNIVAQKGYALEVENDFCEWEMAVDGIKTINRKLKALRGNLYDNPIFDA